MPIYEYECNECGCRFEAFQKISDKPLSKCPHCGGVLKKLVPSGVAIIYKGTGFSKVDSRIDKEMQLIERALSDDRPVTKTEMEVAAEQLEKRCERLGQDKKQAIAELFGQRKKKRKDEKKFKEELRKKALEQRKQIEK